MDNQQKYIAGIIGIIIFASLFGCTAPVPLTGTNEAQLPAQPPQGSGGVSASGGVSTSGGDELTAVTQLVALGIGEITDIQVINQSSTATGFTALLRVPNPSGAPIAVNVYPAVNHTNLDEHVWVSVYGIQQEITYFDTPRAYYTIQTPLAPATFFANVSAASLPISTIEGSHMLIVTDTMTFTPQSTGSQDVLITYEASEMPLELFVFVNGQNVTLIP